MIPTFFRFTKGSERQEKLLLIACCFLVGACWGLATIAYVRDRSSEFILYNLGFSLVFIGLYLVARKHFESSLLWLAMSYQVFVFGHSYYWHPGTQVEAALGLMICIAPLFFKGTKLWTIVAINFVLFHISLLHAGYEKFFNGLYFIYIVVFGIVWTLVRENDQYEKELVASKSQVEKNAAQLEQAYAFKTRFFINITHELKTPLTLIISPIRSLLNKDKASKEEQQLLEVVDKNAHILMNRVNQLLELAKIDRDEVQIRKKHFDIVQLIYSLRDQFLPLAMTKEVALVVEDQSVGARIIYSDQVKVEMILSNIISNALKFSEIGGKVLLAYKDLGAAVQLSVQDNGIGIPERDRKKVFQRFYQVDRPDYHEGSGIGLALSEELTHKLGGDIWVEGNEDNGCTFCVKLPKGAVKESDEITGDERRTSPQMPAASDAQQLNQPAILLVEDNEDLAQYLQLLLKKSHSVLWASNGREALHLLEKLHAEARLPKLIITDLMMPVLTGQELISKLKLDPRFFPIPIIVMTALSEMGIKLELIRIGIDDYITKPFFEEELMTIVEKHLPVPTQLEEEEVETEAVSLVDMEWLQKVESILLEKVGESSFTLQDLAADLFMSIRSMQIKLKQLTGKTPKQYQRAIVLQFARGKIQSGEFDTVYAASSSVGFEDQHYFSTLYKKHFGITPKDEINRLKS